VGRDKRTGVDILAAIAAVLAATMAFGVARVFLRQGDAPVIWFFVGLVAAVLLSAYAIVRQAPRRGMALWASGLLLIGLGVLAILSVGLPIMIAGFIALIAAARANPPIDV